MRHTKYNRRFGSLTQSEDGVAYLLPHSNYAGSMSSASVLNTNDPYMTEGGGGGGAFLQPRPDSFMYGGESAQQGLRSRYGQSSYRYPDDAILSQKEDLTDQPVGVLLLKDISRKESGKYSVVATSLRGSVNSTFHIDVLCKYESFVLKLPVNVMMNIAGVKIIRLLRIMIFNSSMHISIDLRIHLMSSQKFFINLF